jgi:hypothetical protein
MSGSLKNATNVMEWGRGYMKPPRYSRYCHVMPQSWADRQQALRVHLQHALSQRKPQLNWEYEYITLIENLIPTDLGNRYDAYQNEHGEIQPLRHFNGNDALGLTIVEAYYELGKWSYQPADPINQPLLMYRIAK